MSHVFHRRSTLRRVVDTGMCAGCGACTAISSQVTMGVDAAGYLRPTLDGELSNEQADSFEAVCPGRVVELRRTASQESLLWGPFEHARTGHAVDARLRRSAASGGALSGLLVHLLRSGRVDAVIHVAASTHPVFGNRTVVSTTADEVMQAAGSRYAPSAPLDGILERLDGETTYAFVGKPCDVSTLRALARRDERIDRQIPYMLSFFCAGVPSLDGAEAILDEMGIRHDEVASFRYRGNGWPGAATAVRIDGSESSMSYADSWGAILSKHLQARCKICPDGTGTTADVVSADAWETNELGYPTFEERDGVSLVISRNPRGEALVVAATESGDIDVTPIDIDAVEAMQPGQFAKAVYSPIRIMALAMTGRRVPRFRNFRLLRRARRASPRRAAMEFIGTIRRRLLGRLNA